MKNFKNGKQVFIVWYKQKKKMVGKEKLMTTKKK